jgi:hypothetical protein
MAPTLPVIMHARTTSVNLGGEVVRACMITGMTPDELAGGTTYYYSRRAANVTLRGKRGHCPPSCRPGQLS